MFNVDKDVTISVGDIIHGDGLEHFLDLLSMEAVGHECLSSINYKLVEVRDGLLVFNVTGEDLEDEDE